METEDIWFNGFPAVWNLVVPTFIIFESSPKQVAVISTILCISQLTNFKMPHLMRVKAMRSVTLPLTIVYLLALTCQSMNYSDQYGANSNLIGRSILLAFPIYIFLISFWRTFYPQVKIGGIGIAGSIGYEESL